MGGVGTHPEPKKFQWRTGCGGFGWVNQLRTSKSRGYTPVISAILGPNYAEPYRAETKAFPCVARLRFTCKTSVAWMEFFHSTVCGSASPVRQAWLGWSVSLFGWVRQFWLDMVRHSLALTGSKSLESILLILGFEFFHQPGPHSLCSLRTFRARGGCPHLCLGQLLCEGQHRKWCPHCISQL